MTTHNLPILQSDTFKPLETCASCFSFVDEGDDSYCTSTPERTLRDASDTACFSLYRCALSAVRMPSGAVYPLTSAMEAQRGRGLRDPEQRAEVEAWLAK